MRAGGYKTTRLTGTYAGGSLARRWRVRARSRLSTGSTATSLPRSPASRTLARSASSDLTSIWFCSASQPCPGSCRRPSPPHSCKPWLVVRSWVETVRPTARSRAHRAGAAPNLRSSTLPLGSRGRAPLSSTHWVSARSPTCRRPFPPARAFDSRCSPTRQRPVIGRKWACAGVGYHGFGYQSWSWRASWRRLSQTARPRRSRTI
mmetsp:Transcript_24101/g.60975  ORF Transcript_24101/g.60975 Transcript_24101/m.60975 type:complete len:205 (-) Transcript_24101:654-1268(-)